ncbi:MAG: hypothetical protein VYD71_01550 [Bacteroidota bacterium]|nr:hypothetical protein [Bacteroidota bacterium]
MNFNIADLKDLEDYLRLNKISKQDICLVGSATLSLIGIREHNDIDIIVHSDHHDKKLSRHQLIEQVNAPWSTLFSDDELIRNSELHILHQGFKFVIPELVYHKKAWHNRTKDQNDIIELNEYALMHVNWNWALVENYLPRPSFFKKVILKIEKRLLSYLYSFKSYLRNETQLNNSCYQMIPTNLLLSKQIIHKQFNRFDLIVRYMAIEAIFNNNDLGIDLYNKMQKKRGGSIYKYPFRAFKKLVGNIQDNGFSLAYPILVNKDFHIVDGAHRLACALFFKEKYIPVKVNKRLDYSPYGINWFEKNDFSSEELNFLRRKKDEIFYKNHLYFEVVLWPPVAQYFDEIEEMIRKEFAVISSVDYKGMANFTTYIKDLYKIDSIKNWKVGLKIKGMSPFSKDIRVVKIEILEPDFREKSNGHLISKKVEELKKQVRALYKDKVDNYFYDIIIHIGDNYSHSKQSQKFLE